MDEEQTLASPIAGGINAVRRNMSSGLFGSRRQNQVPQSDSITTNLLTNQSLELKSVSRQLEVISNQMTNINASLSGVKESLALSDSIDRQRERAKQNRERILAEQGLREGKESELEKKIQTALVSPIKRIGEKAQGVLFNFQKFFLLLAGGWLTNVGIDLINALVTGNTDQINKLKNKFTIGLVAISGTLTALNVGIKTIFRLLNVFVGSVARFAFGGFVGNTLAGLRLFLRNIAVKAGLAAAGGGFLGGTTATAAASGIAGGSIASRFVKGKTLSKIPANKIVNFTRTPALTGAGFGQRFLPPNAASRVTVGSGKSGFQLFSEGADKITAAGKKGIFGKLRQSGASFSKLMTGGGATASSKIITEGTERVAKKGLMSALKKFASKGLGKFFKGFGPVGALIEFAINLSQGMGVGEALVEIARSSALFAIGQALIPIPFVGGMIGIFLGDQLLNSFGKLIQNVFGFKLPKAIVGDIDGGSKIEKILGPDDYEMRPISSTEDNISAISNNNDKIADNLIEEDSSSVAVIQAQGGGGGGTSAPQMTGGKEPNALPSIAFNTGNPHTLFAVSQIGVA
tara:strand:- start:5054 stop:6778 length:1725 start_codon:yes stop_codon:yes gene_type:complete